MPSEHSSCPHTDNPVEQALFTAALKTAGSPHPNSFIDEIDWRLSRATNAVDGLTSLLSNAEFYEFEIPAAGLYGIASLILNELKTVQVLCERRDKTEIQAANEATR